MQAVSRKSCIACLNTKRINQIPICRESVFRSYGLQKEKKRTVRTERSLVVKVQGSDREGKPEELIQEMKIEIEKLKHGG